MSKFRELIESILLEGFIPSKAPVANLTKLLVKSLTDKPLVDDKKNAVSSTPLEIEKVSEGHDKRKKDEIVSYYLNITATKTYILRGTKIELPVTIKCRCSTHDKPNQEIDPPKDINVYVPAPDNPKPIVRNGLDCYDLSQDKLTAYVEEGRKAIAKALIDKRKHMLEPLLQISKNDKMYNDLISDDMLSQDLVYKYKSLNNGKTYFKSYFQDWLNNVKKVRG